MSTGLTWVVVNDFGVIAPESVTWCQSFNDYDEAKNFALWNAKLTNFLAGGASTQYYFIYTSGPNENGYTVSDTSSPVFTPYD